MAYLHSHIRELFRFVAASDAPAEIRQEASRYTDLEIDSPIPDLAWPLLYDAIDRARWPGKRALNAEIGRRTRHGG